MTTGDRSVKSLPSESKQEIKELCKKLIDMLASGYTISKEIGLKNLRRNIWEVRKGLKLRILFGWQADYVEFILAGTHDDIKKFLRR